VSTAGGVTTKSARRVHEAWKTATARAVAARYTNLETSGHLMPIDAPDAVISAIAGVLDAVEVPAHRALETPPVGEQQVVEDRRS
jgi:hypothetical protein